MYEQASSWLEEEKREEVTKKRIQKALGNKEFREKNKYTSNCFEATESLEHALTSYTKNKKEKRKTMKCKK